MALEDLLASWTGPSSVTEKDKQDRTERMVREAVSAHPAFESASLRVFAKGSYANNTNVRADSDVDIAVECRDVVYWREHTTGAHPPALPYEGEWTPARLRQELAYALRAKFGTVVDSSGNTAIRVHSSTARVEADVVPSFTFHYYFSATSYREGTKTFKSDNNSAVENYPAQHMEKGREKNTRTNQAYKKTVRILKRVENAMATTGYHAEVPSYLIECLVYNCPDDMFRLSTWSSVTQAVVAHIYNELEGAEPNDEDGRWLEVNECKFLFHSGQKWTRAAARDFALAAWRHLDLAKD